MSELYQIPRNYRRSNKGYLPVFLIDYEHYFYLNSEETFEDLDFDDWVMGLFDESGNEIEVFNTLQKDIITGAEFRVYSLFTIPDTVPVGNYFFAIYNSVDQSLKYQSNCFKVISEDMVEHYAFLIFGNSTNMFNFNYETLPELNSVFLDMNIIEDEPEFELKQYVERTTGITRNQKSQARKSFMMESFFFDDGANDAMLALTIHDDITINGKIVEVKEGFKIDNKKLNSVQKGSITFYDQSVSVINLKG